VNFSVLSSLKTARIGNFADVCGNLGGAYAEESGVAFLAAGLQILATWLECGAGLSPSMCRNRGVHVPDPDASL
jgi:hypothetical protein